MHEEEWLSTGEPLLYYFSSQSYSQLAKYLQLPAVSLHLHHCDSWGSDPCSVIFFPWASGRQTYYHQLTVQYLVILYQTCLARSLTCISSQQSHKKKKECVWCSMVYILIQPEILRKPHLKKPPHMITLLPKNMHPHVYMCHFFHTA